MASSLSTVTRNKRSNLASQKSLAQIRGEHYLSYAKRYLADNKPLQALSAAEEGARLSSGPFYLMVQDQLSDLLKQLRP